jgi:hypothetical protein
MNKSRGRISIWLSVLAAGLLVAFLGISVMEWIKSQRAAASFAIGTQAIGRMLRNMQNHPDGSLEQQYLVDAYERALKSLHGLTAADLSGPMPIAAFFVAREKAADVTPSLTVEWLERDFAVTGVYIIDTAGRTHDFGAAFEWESGHKSLLAGTHFLSCGLAIAIDGKTAARWEAAESRWPIIRLERELLRGDVKIGLLTKDGDRTAPIGAYVDEKLIRDR